MHSNHPPHRQLHHQHWSTPMTVELLIAIAILTSATMWVAHTMHHDVELRETAAIIVFILLVCAAVSWSAYIVTTQALQ